MAALPASAARAAGAMRACIHGIMAVLSRPANSPRGQMLWIVGVTGGFSLAVIGMFIWMAAHSRQIVIRDTYVSSSNLALSVEQFVARTVETVDLSLRAVIDQMGARRSGPDINALLGARLRSVPQMAALLVIGADGHVRYAAPRGADRPLDLSRSDLFRRARESRDVRVIVSSGIPGLRQSRAILVLRRFESVNGHFAGIVAAVLRADYLQRLLSTLHVGDHGTITVATNDGTLLVRQPYRGDDIGRNLSATPLFAQWLPWASSGVFPLTGSDGIRRIAGYQRLDRLPLVVEVALAEKEALAEWRRTTLIQGAVGVVILLFAALTALALDRQLHARMAAHAQLRATVGELEKARLAAEESNHVKSQFMANMSHELRTPLNAVIGYSEMLIEEAEAHARTEQLADLRRITHAGQRLKELIDDVLDMSAFDVGRLELEAETEVDLTEIAAACQHAMAERVAAAGLDLAVEASPALPRLRGDVRRLKQIMLNLLSNAVKFTPPGGSIRLSLARSAPGGLALIVADTGIGMNETEVAVALAPFGQVDASLTRRQEGTGIGLPLARTLVELHGGTLTIASRPGSGTTVTVLLPAERVISKDGPELRARRTALSG